MDSELKKNLSQQLESALTSGNKETGKKIAKRALDRGISPSEFFISIVQPQLHEIGEKFERLEIFLPALMKSANVVLAMQEQVLEPALTARDEEHTELGTVILGTVQSDIHDIGKNMVKLMLRVNGFNVIDLGTDTKVTDFIKAAEIKQADIIGASSLLTTSLPYIEDLITRTHELGLDSEYKIIIGGAPVSETFAADVGADAYGSDAIHGVKMCRQLVGKEE